MKLASRDLFLLGTLAPLGLVGFAVVLTTVYHVAACPLCIVQRALYLLITLASLLGLACINSRPARIVAALVTIASAAAGAAIAGYQIYLQRNPFSATCGDGTSWWERMVEQAGNLLPTLFKANGMCSDSAWSLFGVSIVEWSLLCFVALFLLGILSLFAKPRRY